MKKSSQVSLILVNIILIIQELSDNHPCFYFSSGDSKAMALVYVSEGRKILRMLEYILISVILKYF